MTDGRFDYLTTGDVRAATTAVRGLSDEQRRDMAKALLTHVREEERPLWWAARATALAVAAVGCLPSAAQVAQLLGRRAVSLRAAHADSVVAVARQRGVTWLADLAHRLAAKLPRTDPDDGWEFVAGLLTAERAAPPTGDTFVTGWVRQLGWLPERWRGVGLPERLAIDPFLDALLPRLFEIDGIGVTMAFDDLRTRERMALPRALAELAGSGRLDRTVLLDGCLSRLLRDDRPASLRAFVALHDLLAPTPDEVVDRAAGYLRLLADAPTPVATMAQKALRQADGVEVEEVLDASRAVLARPDKALVKAQLSWLDQLARRLPDRAAGIAEVLTVALDHPAAGVRDRAGALTARHGHAPAPAVVTVVGDDLPPPPAPLPAPPPITDPDELAEEVGALLDGQLRALPLDRVLDGLVRLAGTDRPALNRALVPVLDRHRHILYDHQWDPCCLCDLLGGVLRTAADPTRAEDRRGRWHALMAAVGPTPEPDHRPSAPTRVPALHRLLRARLAEVGSRVGQPGYPELLATPTSATGTVDPVALYERIARLGADGPWRWDLTQALLRLPPGADAPLAAKAAALRSPAGDRLATWLRDGGLPRPVPEVLTVSRRERRKPAARWSADWEYDRLPERRRQVRLTPPEGYHDRWGLLTVPPSPVGTHQGDRAVLWASVLPWHPGVVAAHALPEVASAADQDVRDATAVLPMLAESGGEGGPALDLALAYGLGARHEADRIATLDALLLRAAAGTLDAPAVGGHLGAVIADGGVLPTRAVAPLRDAAAAGAPLSTWRLLAAALPALLAAPTAPRGTPDLLTLAAETAARTGVRIEVPGLAEVAGRGGSSRLVREARRLAEALDR
ncbi:DUF6493 family protein [Micromonospora sagamiensis]|uniref:Secreted protein n=1 Tax=Micromonospora sagamiensis TaxID=47875 RepID=A0A562WFP9_9ACTN|nr:DUF6493 family protein [Micromonospora sagamiensis]TWJ28965.1 hypothetical protein JD81_02471 [Micromonospora sagamiensis]BCL18011.1 hypothetical protein GCM10017556_57500 [Micromonospora sagamiensis]